MQIRDTIIYYETNIKVKSFLRTDKQSHLDELAAADNQQGALYSITNSISGRGYRTDTFEDRQEQTELDARWAAEHLKEALNKEPVDT